MNCNIYFVILCKIVPWLVMSHLPLAKINLHLSKGTCFVGVDFIPDTLRVVSFSSEHSCFCCRVTCCLAFICAQVCLSHKNMNPSLHSFHTLSLKKEMATHSRILAWRIPWTEEPGGLWSTGSQRVGHDWWLSTHAKIRRGDSESLMWGIWAYGDPRKIGGWQRMRWLDGITDLKTCVWASSGRWWRTGKPGVL